MARPTTETIKEGAITGGALPAFALFDCTRLHARLTVPSCSARWRKARANRPDPANSLTHCRDCPIGAVHAGEKIEAVELAADDWRMVCSRCLHIADRLIRGRHCISCYNRHREVKAGRDRKGNRPGLTDRLRRISVAVTAGAETRILSEHRTLGAWEVMIPHARAAAGRVAFGPPPAPNWHEIAQRMADANQIPSPTHPSEQPAPCRRRALSPVQNALLGSTSLTWPNLARKRAALAARIVDARLTFMSAAASAPTECAGTSRRR